MGWELVIGCAVTSCRGFDKGSFDGLFGDSNNSLMMAPLLALMMVSMRVPLMVCLTILMMF